MSQKETIRRILREEIKIPLSIRRRVDFDVIDKEFNRVLDMASETLVQKKSKLISMTAEKFGILVTGRVMGEICYLYPVLCEDNTGLYDTIWEFIKEYYAKQTTERYYDIMFGDINESILKEETDDVNKESIIRILREETKSKFFRRRVDLDDLKRYLPINAQDVYYETKSYLQFRYELTLRAVESIMWNEHELGYEDYTEQEETEFVTEVSHFLERDIKLLYNFYKKNEPERNY